MNAMGVSGCGLAALLAVSAALAEVNDTATTTAARIDAALAGDHRSPANRARDRYRHPRETLLFCGLRPDQTVVEIWPGRGWYTEVLAPVLRDTGRLYVAGFSLTARRTPQWRRRMQRAFLAHLAERPDVYDQVVPTALSVPEDTAIAPPGSADLVLTFRNVHNWLKGGYAQQVFAAMHRALKPGGHLCVVEHRAPPGTPLERMKDTGYVTEAKVIELAGQAGLRLEARSEVNANPRDTADHPAGVWTLPPTLRLGDKDRERYLAIGESDRMTLRFVKP